MDDDNTTNGDKESLGSQSIDSDKENVSETNDTITNNQNDEVETNASKQ